MRFTLLSHGEPVGSSDLDAYAPGECAAVGAFTPGPAWPRVQATYARAALEAEGDRRAPPRPHAEAWRATVERSAALHAALGFALVDAAGRPVATTQVQVGPAEGDGLELAAGLARPEEWLATYGAPYRAAGRHCEDVPES
jgi:hypothetical protein